jgi:hypothetical protein
MLPPGRYKERGPQAARSAAIAFVVCEAIGLKACLTFGGLIDNVIAHNDLSFKKLTQGTQELR